MSKKAGLISTVGGLISSTIGIIGAACAVCGPVCVPVCCAGPAVAILGVGVAGFLHRYNIVFIVIGGLLFLLGIFLMIRKRKTGCGCPAPNGEQKRN